MIPFGNETVTLYHNSSGTVTRHVLKNCSWSQQTIRNITDGNVEYGSATTVRYTPDQQIADVGDVFVLGNVSDTVADSIGFAALIEAHRLTGAFQCTSFSDNSLSGAPLPHYCARG